MKHRNTPLFFLFVRISTKKGRLFASVSNLHRYNRPMNSRGQRATLRIWLAVLFLIFALVMLVISLLPEMRARQLIPMPDLVSINVENPTPAAGATATPQPALFEQRELVLEWPETMREQDSDLINLTIAVEQRGQITATAQMSQPSGGTPIDIPNLYTTHNLFAIARLDLAGVEAYREEIREQMHPGMPVAFSWSIHANEPGTFQGVVWLRLEVVPKNGGQMEDYLLLARQIEVKVVTVLGLSGSLARILSGAGLLLSTILGYPFIQSRIAEWLKRRKTKKQPPGGQSSPPEKGTGEVHPPEEK